MSRGRLLGAGGAPRDETVLMITRADESWDSRD